MIGECPFCRARYSIDRKKAASIIARSRLRYGYDPVDRERGVIVWPCRAHTRDFATLMQRIQEIRDRLNNEVIKQVVERVKELKKHVFTIAGRVAEEAANKLGPGEGVIVWVTDGSKKNGMYMDLVVAYVNMNGVVKRVYGGLEPRLSYNVSWQTSSTHYIAQELGILIERYGGVRWKSIIQGLVLDDDMTRKVIISIFLQTHSRPVDSLIDILRDPSGIGAEDIRRAVKTAEKIHDIYVLAFPTVLEDEIRKKLESRAGVPLDIITPRHLARLIKRSEEDEEEEMVSN